MSKRIRLGLTVTLLLMRFQISFKLTGIIFFSRISFEKVWFF
jgi:hypothetical protein